MRPECELVIVEDDLEEEDGPLEKRSRLWSSPAEYDPLDEPGPLGLRLKKSPSFLELIQMRLSNSCDPKAKTQSAGKGSIEKVKASNFPGLRLKIGQWEYKSSYVGDFVAKCYFAKKKLVWEVLENGLKSKMEIQWADIMGLKANFPDDGPGTLSLVLSTQPLFFQERNSRPRKHTLWQASSDFTHGQASMNRLHILQCGQGILNKHFEKLVKCDHRLFELSRQKEIALDSPYFDAPPSIFGNLNLNTAPSISVGAQSSSQLMYPSHDSPSPSSVIDAQVVNTIETADCGEMEEVGLDRSMSLSDSVGLLSNESGQVDDGMHQSMSVSDFIELLSDSAGGNHPEHLEELEKVKQQLLSDDDIQFDTRDEESLVPRVNSLVNLLHKDPNTQQLNTETLKSQPNDLNQGMLRNDSFGDLLLHLPRIESLPKFMSILSEEDDDAFNNFL